MSLQLILIALLGLLILGLGFAVSMVRARLNIIHGCPQDPENTLYKVQRAHGNTIEYAPIIAILILALAQSNYPSWVLWCMGLATLC